MKTMLDDRQAMLSRLTAIMQSLAGFDDELSGNAIEQYVSRLRKRLAPHGLTVKTARGIGYYLERLPEIAE